MEKFSIEKALELGIGRVRTRCGFKVKAIGETKDDSFPIFAVVAEEVTTGRGRRKKTHIENNVVLYRSDGRLCEDTEDDFDLVIMEE